MVPYVKRVCEPRQLPGMFAIVFSHGEQNQISTFMEAESILMLDDALILEAMHAALLSARGNAPDAGNYFKATKSRVKHKPNEVVEVNTVDLRRVLDETFAKTLRIHRNKSECRWCV